MYCCKEVCACVCSNVYRRLSLRLCYCEIFSILDSSISREIIFIHLISTHLYHGLDSGRFFMHIFPLVASIRTNKHFKNIFQIRKFFVFLHDQRLFTSTHPPNVMETQLPSPLPLSHTRQSLHSLLHMPTSHLLFLHGICRHVHRKGKKLHKMVDTNQTSNIGNHHFPHLGRGSRNIRTTASILLGIRTRRRGFHGHHVGMVLPILLGSLEHTPRNGICA